MKLEDWIKSLSKSTAKEITELRAIRTELAAWHTQFGTTQLSHALAERDRLRREKAELAAACLLAADMNPYGDLKNGVAIQACQEALKGNSAVLRDLLAPMERLLDELEHTYTGSDRILRTIKLNRVRLQALVKEGQ